MHLDTKFSLRTARLSPIHIVPLYFLINFACLSIRLIEIPLFGLRTTQSASLNQILPFRNCLTSQFLKASLTMKLLTKFLIIGNVYTNGFTVSRPTLQKLSMPTNGDNGVIPF